MKQELSIEQLLQKVKDLESRVEEYDQWIEAIKSGDVDGFALHKNDQPEIFTLEGSDYAYRVLVENFGEGALTLSDEAMVLYTNNYFLDLLGLPYEAVISKPFLQFIHTDSKAVFQELFKKGLSGQVKGEIQLDTGQKTVPVYVSLTSLYPQMRTVGLIVSDLTEKKESEAKLRRSEETYHAMVSQVRDYAILFLNKDGIVENWNEGAQKIKGYTAEEIIGKSFRTFYSEEDLKNQLPETLLEIARQNDNAKHEGWRVRKDGSLFWGSVVITALHDDKQNIIGFSKVTRDLTERKKAEDKQKENARLLEQKNAELEKMNKELQSFAYISSHDLQEPLRKIQTFVSRIKEKEADNLSEIGRDYFTRMQTSAKRMQSLIDDLLAYSRTNANEKKFERIALNTIVDQVIESLEEEILSKQARVEVRMDCTVDLIPFQFFQLLHNLVSNALKFSRQEIAPHIVLECQTAKGAKFDGVALPAQESYCRISVSDNGIGFEPQYAERIFQLFQRLHGKNEYQGTGIGLAIVKKIVENHNGVISVNGDPNKGARFDIYLPSTQVPLSEETFPPAPLSV